MKPTPLLALLLATLASFACSSPPSEVEHLPTVPDRAPPVSNDAPADAGPATEPTSESEVDEVPIGEVPPALPAPDAGPTPSSSPLCGADRTCASKATTGAAACKQQPASTKDIYCCPVSGDRIEDGKCARPPVCGTGLTCALNRLSGTSSCRQQTTSTTNVWCCPNPGAKLVDGKCQ